MAWVDRVLVVLEEHKYKDELKHKWEITRRESAEDKRHFDAGLVKTGYYKKDGAIVRGYPQPILTRDLKWLDENRARVDAALAAKYEILGAAPTPTQDDGGPVEETPF